MNGQDGVGASCHMSCQLLAAALASACHFQLPHLCCPIRFSNFAWNNLTGLLLQELQELNSDHASNAVTGTLYVSLEQPDHPSRRALPVP